MDWLTFIIVGLIAGWLAGIITRARGLGCLMDIVVGVIGAIIGGYLFSLIDVAPQSFLGRVATATVGAVLLLLLLNAIAGKPSGRR
ncbi:MAG: GlsB/YeaQ/YmgE family stress response membrane protein [Thermoleophilia bacterium]|nr:GlsB/YeaQ/YmgE family stress response membrane protein [Thermoleophilia bacterium]